MNNIYGYAIILKDHKGLFSIIIFDTKQEAEIQGGKWVGTGHFQFLGICDLIHDSRNMITI